MFLRKTPWLWEESGSIHLAVFNWEVGVASFQPAFEVCTAIGLDGLVVIGGDVPWQKGGLGTYG